MDKKDFILNVNNLSYKYTKDKVLEDVSLEVPRGAFLAIVGPNGSGKSTLLKLILGLLKTQTGTIELFGENIRQFKDMAEDWFCFSKGEFV